MKVQLCQKKWHNTSFQQLNRSIHGPKKIEPDFSLIQQLYKRTFQHRVRVSRLGSIVVLGTLSPRKSIHVSLHPIFFKLGSACRCVPMHRKIEGISHLQLRVIENVLRKWLSGLYIWGMMKYTYLLPARPNEVVINNIIRWINDFEDIIIILILLNYNLRWKAKKGK